MGRQALPRRLVALAALAASLVLVTAAGAADAPVATITQTLAGLNDVASGGLAPPDVQVAAGPGFVVEMVNLAERVWRTSGVTSAQVVRTEPLGNFFSSGDDSLTDPRIVYDASSGRWLASISDIDTTSVLLAVSTGADPTGDWIVSSFAAPGCADQPRLGAADGIVVLAADVFTQCEGGSGTALGSELWIVNKEQLLSGSVTPAVTTYGPDPAYSSLAPAQSLSPTATEYVVSVDRPFSRVVHLVAVDGIPPAEVRVKEVASPSIGRLTRPPFAAQPPTGAGRPQPLIETNDDRVLDSAWDNGRLWFSANTTCTPPGDALVRACGRVGELSTVTRTLDWETDLAQARAHVFYPAIRPDGAGNLVIVFAESGTGVLPEAVAVGRTQDGAFTAPVVIAQSAGPYLADRYGDYFGAARDPVDPGVVWVAGEAGTEVRGGFGWVTALASVVVTPAGAALPAVVIAAPPGVRALRTARRTAGAVRLGYRALADGLGIRSIVTLRRKRSVVFFQTTAKAILRADQLYYVLWRPAKKPHGKFTLCVRTVSSAGIESPQSCSAITLG